MSNDTENATRQGSFQLSRRKILTAGGATLVGTAMLGLSPLANILGQNTRPQDIGRRG